MTTTNERIAQRVERLNAKAERLDQEAADARQQIRDIDMPFGQPIVNDRTRRGYEKIRRLIDKVAASHREAEEVRNVATNVQHTGAILTTDDDAIEGLTAKVATLKAEQERMVSINKGWRSFTKTGQRGVLYAAGMDDAAIDTLAADLAHPERRPWRNVPFPQYQLNNASASIRRLKARIEEIEKKSALVPDEAIVRGVSIITAPEANRLRLRFPDRPTPEQHACLKQYGWRWTPSLGVWQQHLSNRARYQAEQIVKLSPLLLEGNTTT